MAENLPIAYKNQRIETADCPPRRATIPTVFSVVYTDFWATGKG
jgi:hypothetical protein